MRSCRVQNGSGKTSKVSQGLARRAPVIGTTIRYVYRGKVRIYIEELYNDLVKSEQQDYKLFPFLQ